LRQPNAPATSETQATAPDPNQVESALALSECRWTTLSVVIAAIDKLLPGADDRGRAILLEYRAYLMRYPLSEDAA